MTKSEERTIHVVGHGWHTGIVLSWGDLDPDLTFVEDHLPARPFYEFGWGEADFYQAEEASLWLGFKALFWKNDTVMHVVAVPSAPDEYFADAETVTLNISERGLARLRAGLRSSFVLDERGRPYPLRRGQYSESRFFRGEGDYFLTKNCNSWTATLLDSAGVPMNTYVTLQAGSVLRQARKAKQTYRCCGAEMR